MARFTLRTLSAPVLLDMDGNQVDLPLGKPFALLIYLAIEGGGVARDDLARLLWPRSPRSRARQSVRQALWLLRKTIGENLLGEDDPVALSPGLIATDLGQVEEAIAAGDLDAARDLWHDGFLHRFALADAPEFERWADEVASGAAMRLADALHADGVARRAGGDLPAAEASFRAATEVEPFAGRHRAMLIETLIDLRHFDKAATAISEARRAGLDISSGLDLAAFGSRVQALRAEASRLEGDPSFRPEFVGRSSELSDLLRLWRRARGGVSCLALVSGPTGIGKTRLAEEMEITARTEGAVVVHVKAAETERRLEWGLGAELVRCLLVLPGAAGISGGSDALLRGFAPSLSAGPIPRSRDGTSQATEAGATEAGATESGQPQGPPTAAGASTGARGSTDPGGRGPAVGPSTVPLPSALPDAVEDLLRAVAFEGPLVLVVDDVQWADGSSLALLSSIIRRVRDEAILFVLTCRSDELPLTTRRGLESLRRELDAPFVELVALSETEVTELLGLMFEFSDPEEASRITGRIHGVTGGNPLFLVELLKELHDEGVIQLIDDRWQFITDRLSDEFPLPGTVKALVDRRLDRVSDDAAALVANLARLPARVSLSTVRRRSGLTEGAFTRAAGELLERQVVRWAESDRLEFVHDQLRDAAQRRFPAAAIAGPVDAAGAAAGADDDPDSFRPGDPPRGHWAWPRTRRGRAMALAAAALLIVALVPVALVSGLIGSSGGDAAPFGGGIVLLERPTGGLLELVPRGATLEEWEIREYASWIPSAVFVTGPFITATNDTLWYGHRTVPDEGPGILRFHRDGRQELIVSNPGDDNLGSVSPDGRYITYISENPATEVYDKDIWIARADGSERRLVFRSAVPLGGAQWSLDGNWLSTIVQGPTDTLVILTPLGERVLTLSGVRQSTSPWCGSLPRLVASAESDWRTVLVIDVRGLRADTVWAPRAVGAAVCSPDGEAIVYPALGDGQIVLALLDLNTGAVSTRPLEAPTRNSRLRWMPSSVPHVPVGISIGEREPELRWGERRRIPVDVRYSDGRVTSGEAVRWASLDPGVASVLPDGRISGNREGRTHLVASVAEWHADTVEVRVIGTPGAEVLVRDDFRDLDTLRIWYPMGWPVAAADTVDGVPVLRMLGDGRWDDGLLSRHVYDLSGGATLELEFRISLTRVDRQSLGLALVSGELRPGASPTVWRNWLTNERIYFLHPSGELAKFTGRNFSFFTQTGLEERRDLPDLFPAEDWVHVAIQLRADGHPFLFLNREFVSALPVPVDNAPDAEWRILLLGRAVDTDLLVRNLALWPGMRYEVPEGL